MIKRMTSISTTNSSSAKDSRSHSSSRVEQFISTEEQPTSPTTSNFPSSAGGAGAQPRDASLSSSHSLSQKPFGFASFSSASPDQWSVAEVSECAKLKGLDGFTAGRFVEHKITGDAPPWLQHRLFPRLCPYPPPPQL
ncbi:hypothetical protein PtA15_1A549 [Puccinia triticina]|nr:uncharacterized protein PtA15_1A549 [Puccinia triticina]WAQ81209.1 hypothetical protein PtA15_1A549 [Puccinia triticina]WAR52108.1 hypothetical protein PtB15_1B547 [Puccinia triticina]